MQACLLGGLDCLWCAHPLVLAGCAPKGDVGEGSSLPPSHSAAYVYPPPDFKL
jgi:hypothetical protein